jgi:protein-disulfide isomerase
MTGLKISSAIFLFLVASGSAASIGCHGQTSAGQAGGAGGEGGKGAAASAVTGPGGDVTLPGVDTSMLTSREKHDWSTYVAALMSPCSDTPVSLAQCVQEKRSCSRCVPGAKYVLRGVRDGMSQEQIEKSYHNRFDPDRVKNVTLDGSPAKGPESAPVTLVEFADFECPFCAMEAPVLEKSWQGHKDSVRFVYKYFVISAHPHGESAARAAIAAGNQGKFWEMHDTLFANRDHLEGADIDSYAKGLGLDMAKLHADMQSAATTDRIERDKKLGESLGVEGTPTIFLNGRAFDPHQDLDDWINLELQSLQSPRAAGTGATGVGAAGSAAPAAPSGKTAAAAPKK